MFLVQDDFYDLYYLAVVLIVIKCYNSVRERHRLTRSALLTPRLSPWNMLLRNGDDGSFLTLTGFNRIAFFNLRNLLFGRDYHGVLTKRPGRPCQLDYNGQLGLLLYYLNSTMKLKHLCQIFGVVETTASNVIRRMIKLAIRKLAKNSFAMVKFPNEDEMELFAEMIHNREPTVSDVIGFTDGVSIPIQCSSDPVEQSKYYNGYHCDTMVNNVFCFAPTGKIIHASTNFPGSWHDSAVCANLIATVLDKIGIYKICVDQGFPRSGDLFDIFVGPMSVKARRKIAEVLLELLLAKHNVYVSLRQSSEWGMRSLQGTFTRLKSRLTSDKEFRGDLIYCIVLLHNFRTEFVGLNQIATVFNPHYEQYVNVDGYDRIARYYDNVTNYVN